MNKSYISFMKNYEQIESFSPRYKLIQNKQSFEPYLLQTTYPQNIPLLKLKTRTLDQHINLRHPHILPLSRYFTSQSGQPTLTAIYHTGSHTLIQQIQARAEERKSFKENEIWAILYGIISAMSHIQSLEIQCSSLSMDLIFLTETGEAKIVDPSFINGISDLEHNKYYSPEEILLLMNPNSESDIFKSNVFITALCVLHCCLLTPVYDYVNVESGTIDFDLLEQYLEQASHLYSEDLIRLLVDMLDEELGSRPDFLELEEHMNRICVVEESASGVIPLSVDIENTRDDRNALHQIDRENQPDIGEGIGQEPNDPRLPKLQLNVLQMSISNNSSLDDNLIKNQEKTRNKSGVGFGLDQLKNLKIADSLSYSAVDLEPYIYKPVDTSYIVKDSLDVKPINSFKGGSYLRESYLPEKEKEFSKSYYPYLNEPIGSYSSYVPATYTPLISNTDQSGLFTSPELLSFLKVDFNTGITSNENMNPN